MPETAVGDIAATPKHDTGRPLVNAPEKSGSSASNPFESSSAAVFSNGDVKELGHMHKPREPVAASPRSRNRSPRIYLNKFRVPIYIQLCVVICILCGLCVMVVAVTTVYAIHSSV